MNENLEALGMYDMCSKYEQTTGDIGIYDVCRGSELKFRIPKEAAASGPGVYRVSYGPSSGFPASNFTVDSSLINQLITISDVLPGTLYTFHLYFSNATLHDKLIWSSDLPTKPERDRDGGKVAEATWDSPKLGGQTGFKLSLVPLSEKDEATARNNYINHLTPFLLRDLTPGASYEVKLFSVFHGQDSSVFVATNFTTKPNTPGRFIVWFRNETTLLVLWQPPYPSGVFDKYRVSISPEDALQSELFVDKERDPPGPAQAAFYGLVPGRNYNISVQTVSDVQISEPTRAQYRTVPLPPVNVTYDPSRLASFLVRCPDEERVVTFDEELEPGQTYEVVVKTVSGNVASWPVTANITTRPLPCENNERHLRARGRNLCEMGASDQQHAGFIQGEVQRHGGLQQRGQLAGGEEHKHQPDVLTSGKELFYQRVRCQQKDLQRTHGRLPAHHKYTSNPFLPVRKALPMTLSFKDLNSLAWRNSSLDFELENLGLKPKKKTHTQSSPNTSGNGRP
ncbi:tyrosine-protein phosphatase 10D [Caerostris extrusa]|uniref:Tyrosine-protein phosphatase 10D n=1 Tax=Caerostris extrusa TaxID=172846 RepID=A0AAV4U265_CAEEX|nr:tyrosine-protein phosphatase 10D [Caerostris extrusa]